ncbi:MAG: T9SS type A sorting domain-containing protein [Bacteroidota bacterium]|nr:T9SS type A sorting domain-containing protein [Bacteroidota bacterium]
MKKTFLLTLISVNIAYGTIAQNVNIPDANFKTYLLSQSAINTNGDTEIQVNEASAFTGIIDCEGQGISSLTGIEVFTALTELICGNNPITTLNVSNNTALERLNCENNQLTTLNVSNNTQLKRLNCNNNDLAQLNINSNIALDNLECENNQLTSLNVSNNVQLLELYINGNALTQIDVSNNTALEIFGCGENQLTTLDVSNNTALYALGCGQNQLTQLNVKNGYNLNFLDFYAKNNPNLTCIQVDNAAYSSTNWTEIDANASFNDNCNNSTGIENQYADIQVKAYPNPVRNILTVVGNVTFKSFQMVNMLGQIIESNQVTNNKINVENIDKGIYTLVLTSTEDSRTTVLIVVE